MKAAILRNYGEPLELVDLDLAPPQAGEVLVSIRSTGVCHSDLSVVRGKLPYPLPCVLGHEAAGVVEEVGPGVTAVQPGDHVVVMWTPMCGECYWCQRGQPYLCPEGQVLGMMDDGTTRLSHEGQTVFHGINAATFAERAVFRENSVVKIDKDIPMDVASVVGCGVLTGV
ncbi:MAG TPA: alcohol dehydrogenase catalytic domain-containing protein, partial [Actinomycetota bacterium]|nr:alcohol dehydrogenase catalytic domain-containing protein [Actinomycetota bacterium]